jgi:threonine/homoserine/homoserine lactone efflux protein
VPVLSEVLPLALGVALSPFPVIPSILLLFSARPRATTSGFLAGWLGGITLAVGLFVVLASAVEAVEETPTWASWTRLVLGAALVVVGLRQWRARGESSETPSWMASLETATVSSAARLGLLLSAANPKVLLLAGAGGLAIGSAELTSTRTLVAALLFVVVASVSVALPLLLHLLLGERVLRPLGRAKDWLAAHNSAVMAVVITAIGVALVVKGASAL